MSNQWSRSDAAGKCKATTTPFAALEAHVEIKALRQRFEAEGRFTLAATSNGIDPSAEDVTFQIGSFSRGIPKGSFPVDPLRGPFEFRGVIGGFPVEAAIAPMVRTFTFEVVMTGVNVAAPGKTTTVQLAIGNDPGTTTAAVESNAC